MKRPPYVFDHGIWRGVLCLIVLEGPGSRAYGVEIQCEVYSAWEEMIYSIADHGDESGAYDGGVYVKEAISSRLVDALVEVYATVDPMKRKVRHFLFVGGDFCYETLGFEEPVIRAFASPEEAQAWVPYRAA